MGLITKEVEVVLCGSNIKHFEDLEYEIPRRISQGKNSIKQGTKIKVKIEDLPIKSGALVDIKCDGCGEILTNIRWSDYNKCVKDDSKYYCHKCATNGNQKWISFYEWCYLHLSKEDADIIMLRWDYELNKISPKDISYSSHGFNQKGYWFKCLDHPEHESEQKNIKSFTIGANKTIKCIRCTRIVITNPEFIKFFVDKKDAYKYSIGDNKKTLLKCPECGYEKEKNISDCANHGFGCPRCSDGVSYPNKFMFEMLSQLQDFIPEYSPYWIKPKRYDFYFKLENKEYIVEMDGGFHYKDNKMDGITKEESRAIDDYKDLKAKKNGIKVIRIDCRESDLEFIKGNILSSELYNLFDLSNINWLKCHAWACTSFVKIACELWRNRIKNTLEIAGILKVNKTTVATYLKQGAELGWCDYDIKKESKKFSNGLRKQVICLNTGEIFNYAADAGEKYNIHFKNITACCHNKTISSGRCIETGKKLMWMYYSEYILKSEEEIEEKINKVIEIKVICLTTGEIFNSQAEAGRKYKIDISSVTKCCRHKAKSAGKHPDTKEKLVWQYYSEYFLDHFS